MPTDLEFFRQEMERGIELQRQEMLAQREIAIGEVRPYIDRWIQELDLAKASELGFMGTMLIEALATVLLTMPMTDWERFYHGHADWSRQVEKCPYKGREEENARGTMLMALKYRCENLQRRLERIHANPA